MWSSPPAPAKPRTRNRPREKRRRFWVQPSLQEEDRLRSGSPPMAPMRKSAVSAKAGVAFGHLRRMGQQRRSCSPSAASRANRRKPSIKFGSTRCVVTESSCIAGIERVGHDEGVDPIEVLGDLQELADPAKARAERADRHAAEAWDFGPAGAPPARRAALRRSVGGTGSGRRRARRRRSTVPCG